MNSTTDGIVLVAFLVFFWNGWRKGFLRTLIGPICLFIGGILGMLYYQKTLNAINSLAISIVFPFLINFIVSTLIKLSQKPKNEDRGLNVGRLAGGIFNLLWSGGMLILVITAIAILPLNVAVLNNIQKNIRRSKTFVVLNHLFGNKLISGSDQIEKITKIFEDPDKLEKIRSKEEFTQVMSDKKIQDMITDEETARQIKEKNIVQLMSNPRIQSIIQDPALVQKLIELNKEIIKDGLSGNLDEKKPQATVPPHTIELH